MKKLKCINTLNLLSRNEANKILKAATPLGLTGKEFMWIASSSILGNVKGFNLENFPLGMMGE